MPAKGVLLAEIADVVVADFAGVEEDQLLLPVDFRNNAAARGKHRQHLVFRDESFPNTGWRGLDGAGIDLHLTACERRVRDQHHHRPRGHAVHLEFEFRRLDCPRCGVKRERLDWLAANLVPNERHRAFCLYVVLGSHARRVPLVAKANMRPSTTLNAVLAGHAVGMQTVWVNRGTVVWPHAQLPHLAVPDLWALCNVLGLV